MAILEPLSPTKQKGALQIVQELRDKHNALLKYYIDLQNKHNTALQKIKTVNSAIDDEKLVSNDLRLELKQIKRQLEKQQ